MKSCTKCKIKKELYEFGKNKSSKDNLQYECKSCQKKYIKERRESYNKKQINLGKCVYLHINPKTKEVFYVGIGREDRAYNFRNRNKFWNNYKNKHGVKVEIIKKGLKIKEACKLEVDLINHYGRRDLKEGTLVNLSNGGEGVKHFANYEDTHKCFCLITQKIYESIRQFCIENNLSYNAVVQFLKNIKNESTKTILKDYNVRQLRNDNTIIWHKTERFVRSEFEDIDDFKDIEFNNYLDFNKINYIIENFNNKPICLSDNSYKTEKHLYIFNLINNGLSYKEACQELNLSYHQVYNSYNKAKKHMKQYLFNNYYL